MDTPTKSRVEHEEIVVELDATPVLDLDKPTTNGTFADFNLPPQIEKALANMKFDAPTEIQRQAIPVVIEGKDLLATAQTGTGKTAAFGIPLLARLLDAQKNKNNDRVLILAPTRELAEQITETFRDLTFAARRIKYATIIGGASYSRQIAALRAKPSFVIGTPGRVNDYIERGTINLAQFKYLVLDEADRMLDMGFEPQIEQIVKGMPEERQTLMFSATMPASLKKLVARYLKEPVRIAIGEQNKPVAKIKQDVVETSEGGKQDALISEIGKVEGSIIVFTKTKVRADLVADLLEDNGHRAEPLHGDLSQGQRRRVTDKFRDQKIRILVATDIAARGLDIPHVRHVINFDLPMVPEDYVHRIGRTGRNGAEGHSIAFVTPKERYLWQRIRVLMGEKPERGGGGGGERRDGHRFGDRKHRGPAPSYGAGRFNQRGPQTRKPFGAGSAITEGGYKKKTSESPVGDRPERKPYGDKPVADRPERKPFGDKPERKAFGDRPERKPYGDKPERKTFGERAERKPFGDKPERKAFGDRPERKPFGDRAERKPFGDKPERKPIGAFGKSERFSPGAKRDASEGPRTWDTDSKPKRFDGPAKRDRFEDRPKRRSFGDDGAPIEKPKRVEGEAKLDRFGDRETERPARKSGVKRFETTKPRRTDGDQPKFGKGQRQFSKSR